MVRLFKHYVPYAVLLLGLIDCALLFVAGNLAWTLRAAQIGIDSGGLGERLGVLAGFVAVVLAAMIAVSVYGSEALRSLRFAGARLLVAVSLAIIALAFLAFLLPGSTFWRSILFYAMGLSIALLMANRFVVGGILGAGAFRRRVLVLGAGPRARRLRGLAERSESGFAIVGYVDMNERQPLV
jgi:FlaA1/EpsC-like NDP-sugar epimerase